MQYTSVGVRVWLVDLYQTEAVLITRILLVSSQRCSNHGHWSLLCCALCAFTCFMVVKSMRPTTPQSGLLLRDGLSFVVCP